MWRSLRVWVAWLCLCLGTFGGIASAQERASIGTLLRQFRAAHDLAAKERILERIAQRGDRSGQQLLRLAKTTDDRDTRWLAIRGLGMLKFREAAPFLVQSLQSDEPYVRANAARALAELRYSPAVPSLIHLLEVEQDAGVIEQTSLALRMTMAVAAIPVLKARISFNSEQTRCWLLDAIAALGSKNDAPFIAQHLYDTDVGADPLCAAGALATLTGEDFGVPKTSGPVDPLAPVLKAREWWEKTQKEQDPH